ncbi:AAA family ATPase [Streptomycetaceae bacterium NBC_01309]
MEKQYTYDSLHADSDPGVSAEALNAALTEAFSGDADFTVIHLLSHGEPTRNRRGLRVVGGDGQLTEALSRWVDLAEDREADGPCASVLLILDLCHSGVVGAEHLRSLIRPELRRVWVLAACPSDKPAYDGRLSLAVDDVLRGFASGELKLDESLKYVPIDRFCREVARRVEEQSAGSYRQTVERPLTALGDDLSHLRFFPNPRYDPAALRSRGSVDPTVYNVLDEVADSRHFVLRAHGADSAFGDSGVPVFTGRSTELRELTAWVEGRGSPLRVVTGVPGAGKSALVSVLTCAAHPELREATEQVWRPSGADVPAAVEGLAVVHARRRMTTEILTSLAAQWGLGSPPRGTAWTTDQLVAALGSMPRPPYLVVDALDEAEHPGDLVAGLLLPLASARRSDTEPLCRILVATRRDEGLHHLLDEAEARGGLVDLDDVPAARLRKDLVYFVSRVLRPLDSRTPPWCSFPAAEGLGGAMADTLLSGPREWGEFLVAALYLRFLQDQKAAPTTVAEAEALGRDIPRTLDAILDLNLKFLGQPGLTEIMAALAWAEGSGMPEAFLAQVAGLPSAPEEPAAVPNPSELLQTVRFYVRRNVDRDGTPLYRLFHQGLADRLRRRPDLDAATVWERLVSMVPTHGNTRRWATAEPYLLRHAARHSALAGALDELLEDGEFLVHADPAPLADELYHRKHGPHSAVYLTSYGAHHHGPPEQRRDILAVDAARHQQGQLAAALSDDTLWSIRWTAGRDLHPGLLTTLTGHRGGITDLTTFVFRGRHHAVTAGQDGTARIWDLNSAETTHELDHHGSAVNSVVAVEANGVSLAVTGCHQGSLRGWDLATGRLLWTRQAAHTGPVRSMVAVPFEGVPAVASAGHDMVVRYWEAATGAPLSSTSLSQAHPVSERVWQLSRVNVDGVGTCVVACWDDWISVFTVRGRQLDDEDLPLTWPQWPTRACYVELEHGLASIAGDTEGTIWIGSDLLEVLDEEHADSITDLVPVIVEGSTFIVSASEDGSARLIEPSPPWRARQVASHTTTITRLAVVHAQDGARLLTASTGGTVRVWDMAAKAVQQRHRGHTHAITDLLALSDGRLVSSSADGTLALWHTGTGERREISLLFEYDGHPYADFANGVALLADGAAPRIAAACANSSFAVWDTHLNEQPLIDRVDDSYTGTTAIVPVTIDGARHIVCGGAEVTLYSTECIDYLTHFPDRVASGDSVVPETGRVLLANNGYDRVTCLSASDTHVFAGYQTGSVRAVPLSGPHRPAEFIFRHEEAVGAISTVNLDGKTHVISGDADGSLRVLTATGNSAPLELVGHTRAVCAIAPVLVGGRPHALSGGLDRSMRLWDLATGKLVDVFWFPDSVLAITVAEDGTVFVGVGPDIISLRPDPGRLPLGPFPGENEGTTCQ